MYGHHHHTAQGHKKFSKTKSEESGYDSDTTRYAGKKLFIIHYQKLSMENPKSTN